MKLLIIEQQDKHKSFDKVVEEYHELKTEHIFNNCEADILAEGMDLMQSTYSYLLIMVDYDLDRLEEANKRHIAKLLGRGHVIAGSVRIDGQK